jgi:hypothetical protein
VILAQACDSARPCESTPVFKSKLGLPFISFSSGQHSDTVPLMLWLGIIRFLFNGRGYHGKHGDSLLLSCVETEVEKFQTFRWILPRRFQTRCLSDGTHTVMGWGTSATARDAGLVYGNVDGTWADRFAGMRLPTLLSSFVAQ